MKVCSSFFKNEDCFFFSGSVPQSGEREREREKERERERKRETETERDRNHFRLVAVEKKMCMHLGFLVCANLRVQFSFTRAHPLLRHASLQGKILKVPTFLSLFLCL